MNRQMARPEWDTPIAVLPNGRFVYASDIKHIGTRTRAWLQGLALFIGFLLICALASFDGVAF